MALPTSGMKKRMLLITAVIVFLGLGALAGKLFYLQIVKNEEYSKQATRQQLREVEISASRGVIYDRDGNVLAQSSSAWTVILSPVNIEEEQKETIVKGLAEILDLPEETVQKAADRDTAYAVVKRKVDWDTSEAVLAFADELKTGAIYCEEDTKRYYPYGNMASAVIGFTGFENNGAYGLESYYDRTLSGTPGKVVSAKNAWGLDMPTKYEQYFDASDGNSIYTTISQEISAIVKRNIDLAVKEHNIKMGAVGVVYNIKTGEVLALESSGGFDPNEPLVISDPDLREIVENMTGDEYSSAKGEAQYAQWRNRCISDPYEPGSVFKILLSAAALEEEIINPNTYSFDCTGSPITIAGQKYNCWKNGGHGHQTFTQCLMNSCNPAFISIGQKLGIEKYREYFKAFGLMELTGIDLPGEAMSIYHSDAVFKTIELASSSIGQSFKVTPIQMIAAVSAAVGGGKLYEPYVVSRIVDSDGNIVESHESVLKRQVISEKTSETVALMCEQVVCGKGGSGKYAFIPGYRIGGKTGTSQKLDKGGNEYVLSFFGFAPADDPEIAVLVALNEPSEVSYGSVIAAPVVGAIMNEILPYLGYEKTFTEQELAETSVKVRNVVGELTHDGYSLLVRDYLDVRVVGEGPKVLKQVPAAGERVDKHTTVILYTDKESLDNN